MHREARRSAYSLKKAIVLRLLFILVSSQWMSGYSMLTHEQIVDVVWTDQIEPLLKQRYPTATDDELNQAHAYAYGGCIIQDLGYYPFGNKDFSNLLHYVRSGDFVVAMLQDADDLNGYAFALGALAHYVSDIDGHPAVNRAVAMDYPKLQRKFGDEVTYDDNHACAYSDRVRFRCGAGCERADSPPTAITISLVFKSTSRSWSKPFARPTGSN